MTQPKSEVKWWQTGDYCEFDTDGDNNCGNSHCWWCGDKYEPPVSEAEAELIARAYLTKFLYDGKPRDDTNAHFMYDMKNTKQEIGRGEHQHLVAIYKAGRDSKMIQPHCKEYMMRDKTIVQCGRVLTGEGTCENEHLHVSITVEGPMVVGKENGKSNEAS